jgi:hypothetical protein
MKLKTIAALLCVGLMAGGCLVEGITAGAVLGFVANNAANAGAAATALKIAIDRYKESENVSEKVRVLADVSCYFRIHHPSEMDFLRSKLEEAGVSTVLVQKARDLADLKCGSAPSSLLDTAPSSEKKPE